jgi:hypothetical protein
MIHPNLNTRAFSRMKPKSLRVKKILDEALKHFVVTKE